MSEIPQGWHSTTLAAVAQLKTGPFGSALHKSDYVAGGTPLINPSHIKHGELQPDDAISIDANALQRLSEYQLQAGDVVMGRRGEMGRCAVVPARAAGWVCGTGSVIVRPSSAILPNYLQRMLSSPGAVERLNGESVGSTMVNLNQGVLLGLPVVLPPLMEQQRIADKLDAVVARVDACRDRLARVTALLKRFRQSVLAAASSGQLTIDWRGSAVGHDGLPPEWTPASFRDVTSEIRYGTSKKCSYQSNGIGVLRIPNILSDGSISVADLKRSDFTPDELEALSLKAGDLLVIRSNGSVDLVGRSAVVSPHEAGLLFAGYLIRIRVEAHKVIPSFAYLCLSCPGQRAQIEATAKSTSGVNNINSDELLSLRLQLPPFEEQAEIVRRVDTLFAFADRLEARLAKAQAAADRLTPALLAKAFRGELVPQDPADEPAAVLLQRLAASRPASVAKARRPRAGQGG